LSPVSQPGRTRATEMGRGGSRTAPTRDAEPDRPLIELAVSDVKQYVYCPRVVYFTGCRQLRRPVTYKMVEGQLEHETTEAREHRRSLRAYGLTEGERHFAVRLRSERLGLSGLLDMAIVTAMETIPVEFKSSSAGVGLNPSG